MEELTLLFRFTGERERESTPRSALILTPTNTVGLGIRFITSSLVYLSNLSIMNRSWDVQERGAQSPLFVCFIALFWNVHPEELICRIIIGRRHV